MNVFAFICIASMFLTSNNQSNCIVNENINSRENIANMTDSILTSDDTTAAIALRTSTSDIATGYSCLITLLPRINEAKGGLDTSELLKEEYQPKFLSFLPQDRYCHLQTRKGIILARFADFIRESENPPLKHDAQKLLLNVFFNEFNENQVKEHLSELMSFAFGCILFDELVEPSNGGDLLLNFVSDCLNNIDRFDSDTRGKIVSSTAKLAGCMKDQRSKAIEFLKKMRPSKEADDYDIYLKRLESVFISNEPISEKRYRDLCNMNAQNLVSELENLQDTPKSNAIIKVVVRQLCGTRKYRRENWEYIWEFISSGKHNTAAQDIFVYLARPLPNDAAIEEKAHVDVFVKYLFNLAINTPKSTAPGVFNCIRYLRTTAIQDDLPELQKTGNNLTKIYGQKMVLDKLLELLKVENIIIIKDTLNELCICTWVNYDAAQTVKHSIEEFQIQISNRNWSQIEKNYPNPEDEINFYVDRVKKENAAAILFFSSKQEKRLSSLLRKSLSVSSKLCFGTSQHTRNFTPTIPCVILH